MTISSSLSAGVAGLNANATRLAAISDNIANSGTYGYKRVQTEFASLVITGSSGSGSYSAGGVRASTTRLIDERGDLVGTSNALDLAIAGRGMLPVAQQVALEDGNAPLLMTRTGSFRPDPDGVLKTDSGLVLMGWAANPDGTIPPAPRDSISGMVPIVVNTNQMVANPTSQIGLGVNLPATYTVAGSTADVPPLSVEYFGNLGTSEALEVTFEPIVPATGASNQWTMEIRDSASGGALIGEYTLTFDDTSGAGGTLASVAVVSGGAYDPVAGTVSLAVAGGPMTVTIGSPGGSSGSPGEPNGITQLSDTFVPLAITKNGSPVGTLTKVEIDQSGYVNATYDTGLTRRLYQVPLVDVPNPNGLLSLNNQTYQVSPNSGAFLLWDAGSGPTGTIEGFSRESSKTDVAAELTNLIQTQRAYSSNAKVIQTVDEMLQETTNIKR
ncbi:flagellar hook-basal body complex protein [Tabrizicola piscis]|uniref:Flagellar hook protein FlgE n=1 Tax=Tabrizicola piscis TaxID=2494374 RepID=A0A3S8U6E9_9RHOB|nr:flagellar hook-basal body complex protein [Tabrizicola piscis]AZL59216.1 flagellar hook-basal body complex protein [Tabrizicola piscis]